jgi:hypothetical protein
VTIPPDDEPEELEELEEPYEVELVEVEVLELELEEEPELAMQSDPLKLYPLMQAMHCPVKRL